MSIAILPMSQEFNWNSATVGLIQSSFFWGYLLTQVCFSLPTVFSITENEITSPCSMSYEHITRHLVMLLPLYGLEVAVSFISVGSGIYLVFKRHI